VQIDGWVVQRLDGIRDHVLRVFNRNVCIIHDDFFLPRLPR
jgi:hypothetical protein